MTEDTRLLFALRLSAILRAVSSFKLRQIEKELQDSVKQKQSLSKEILLLKLREQTYADLEFNRLNRATTYRELKHQVTKKRKIWPVRKLMSELSERALIELDHGKLTRLDLRTCHARLGNGSPPH